MTSLHDLGERRVVSDRVKIGVLIHLCEIGIVVRDRLPEQLETSRLQSGGWCCVCGVDRSPPSPTTVLRCQRKSTGGVIAQFCILGLFSDRGFQVLKRLIWPLAQFRRHDSGEVEFGMLRGVSLLELLQLRLGVLLLAEPGQGNDPVLFGGDGVPGSS